MQTDVQTEGNTITQQDLTELMQPTTGPCVSIYVNAAPAEGADQGRIRFKAAIQHAGQSLKEHDDPGQEGNFLDPLRGIADDSDVWLSARHGLAAFLSKDALHVRALPEPLPDFTVVADSFHVKPLIRLVQGADRFQILAVSAERVALYEGDQHHIEEVPLHPDVPTSMADALGEPARVTKQKNATFVPDDSDQRDTQLTRYFRRIDDAIWEHHSRESDLPLIFAGVNEYHTFFRRASHNKNLVEVGIKREPFHGIDADGLRGLAVEAIRPVWEKKIAELRERFGNAKAHGQGSDQVNEIAAQAAFGKVDTLLIEENKRVGGTIDRGTGEIAFRAIGDPHTDDVLDDIAEMVLRQKGRVLVLNGKEMPTEHGVAAIFRY